MSSNRLERARFKRDDQVAIKNSLADHQQDVMDAEREHSDWFTRMYMEDLEEEFRRRSILEGYDSEGEQFLSEEDHRTAVLSLGHLWPSEQHEHAETLGRLNLAQ